MTKQRLAEIMAEIDEGCEELYENKTTVILGVHEKKHEGASVGILGIPDIEAGEMIAVSILNAIWEQEYKDKTSFGNYMKSIYMAATEADNEGLFKKTE